METQDLIKRVASGDMTEDEQLALLAQVEASIQLRKQAKLVEQELSAFEEAATLIADTLQQHKAEVNRSLEEVYSYVRQPGPSGKDGKDGKIGKDGRDGLNGRDGINGKDGQDGLNGRDGVSITDVYWAADGSLVCVLSDGREIDTGPLLEAGTGSNTNVSVSQWAGYSTEELKQTFIYNTFETVSKNLASSGGTLAYDANGDLVTITYDNGILKTLAYDGNGDLISLTLSGSTPESIDLVKTFSYDANGDLVTFVYS